MPAAFRYIATGLLMGVCAAGLFAGAALFATGQMDFLAPASPTPTITATFVPAATALPTLTSSPTPTPLPTLVPTAIPPTATPDALQVLISSGGLAFAGPLSNVEQIHLYQASLNYIATDLADSRRMSKQINGVGYGDPSNICGPLSIAILADAGLMTPEIIPHDFWLLDPMRSTDQKLLRTAFPSSQYEYSRIVTPLNKIDWRTAPLVPGDFLFIWHGSGGNFDHMLVVTRVDSSMRTYAVTNYGTSAGFVIAEVLLYDPSDPAAGLFHTWTRERDAILGSTGFGGYELWRRKLP